MKNYSHVKTTLQTFCILVFLGFQSCIFAQNQENEPFKIIGYFASWTDDGEEDKIEYNRYTHLIFSFAVPDTTGHLKPLEYPKKLEKIIRNAHENNVKVLIAVGGWNDRENGEILGLRFNTFAQKPESRQNLVHDILELVKKFNLDGVDIDWEYPTKDSEKFALVMKTLHLELKKENKLLTAAVSANALNGKGIKTEVFEYVDFLNLMAYDGGAGAEHSPFSYAEKSLDYWLQERGLPKEKTVLGLPFYARPSWKPYKTLLAEGADPKNDFFKENYFNAIETIRRKTQLATQRAGGIMIWEISQDVHDKHSLLRAAYDQIHAPASANK